MLASWMPSYFTVCMIAKLHHFICSPQQDFILILPLLHRVSKKKLCKLIFCQNFVKFRPIVKIFGTEIAKRTGVSEVYSISTSPNLCQRTTVLNADVPKCYITVSSLVCSKLSDELISTQYGLFSRIIGLYNSSVQNCQNLCPKCAQRTQTKALRWRHYWLIAVSTIDWSNCARLSIRRVLSSSTSAILER